MPKPWWRRRRLWVPTLAALLLGAAYLGLWLPVQPAVRFLRALGGPEPTTAEFEPQATWGDDSFTLGPAPREPPRPTILVVHGVTDSGIHDSRVWRLALALHAAGFTVHVPEIRGMKRLGEGKDDVARIRRALAALESGLVPGADGRRIGLMGISLGGALALRAASAGGASPRALLLVGAPDDTLSLAREWFRRPDATAQEGEEERSHAEAARFARLGALHLAMDSLVPPADLETIRRWIADPPGWRVPPWPSDVVLSTDGGRRFAASASAGPAIADGDLAWILDGAARGGLATMSPAAWDSTLDGLRAPCFLIHGMHDPLVALPEMDRLAARLSRRTRVETLASGLLEHVGVSTPGIAGGWRHARFIQAFFDAVRDGG